MTENPPLRLGRKKSPKWLSVPLVIILCSKRGRQKGLGVKKQTMPPAPIMKVTSDLLQDDDNPEEATHLLRGTGVKKTTHWQNNRENSAASYNFEERESNFHYVVTEAGDKV